MSRRRRGRQRGWAVAVAMAIASTATAAAACGRDVATVPVTTTTPPLPAVPADAQEAVVVAVGDAATIDVRLTGAGDARVALIGVGPPVADECFAAESSAFAEQALAAGSTLRLAADTQDAAADGSLLRYPWDAAGVLYNADVARQGFANATATAPDDRFRVELFEAQVETEQAGRGVWACPGEAASTQRAPAPTAATTPRPPVPAPATTELRRRPSRQRPPRVGRWPRVRPSRSTSARR